MRNARPEPGGARPPALSPPDGLEAAGLEPRFAGLVLLSWLIRPADVPAGALTTAEAEVARLAVGGLGNGEIARRRARSARTVANQLASVYRKLGVGSRLELAARLATLARGTGAGS